MVFRRLIQTFKDITETLRGLEINRKFGRDEFLCYLGYQERISKKEYQTFLFKMKEVKPVEKFIGMVQSGGYQNLYIH